MKSKVDYIIVGQGIAGTWLSHELISRGHEIVVFDHETANTSSKKAAGLYNPITGRKMVKTWRADDFFPNLEAEYEKLEKVLGSKFLYPKPIYRPFRNIEDLNDWQGKQEDPSLGTYLKFLANKSLAIKDVNDPLGGLVLSKSGYVDLPSLISAYRKLLTSKGLYIGELFKSENLIFQNGKVEYENWIAKKVVFCEGVVGSGLWGNLPFRPVRGEIIDIICDLDSEYIINQGVFMIPKKDHFTVGSTYDHSLLTYEPQQKGIENILARLEKIYKGAIKVKEARAGVRPATHDRKPYIGFHKEFQTLGIFNGFGTKGVSLSPYFAKHFVDVLEGRLEIDEEVNVQRTY